MGLLISASICPGLKQIHSQDYLLSSPQKGTAFSLFPNCSVTLVLKRDVDRSTTGKKSIDTNVNEVYGLTVIHAQEMKRLDRNPNPGDKVQMCPLSSST
jgi:hypothetical protein